MFDKNSFFKNLSEEMKIKVYYRYLSLFVTSLFYFMGESNHFIQNKIFIVTCIALSSIILTYLYIKNQNSNQKIKLLIFIETIGNSCILIPSGGLNSPYIWYALNTILITSIKLNRKYCWMNLFVYLFASTGIVYFVFDKGKITYLELMNKESNLIISFILITIAVQLLLKLIKEVEKERNTLVQTNQQLVAANKKIKESMEHIMSLYQAVDSFTNQRDQQDLIRVLMHYTKKITKTDTVFFASIMNGQNEIMAEGNDKFRFLIDDLKNKIINKWNNILKHEMPMEINVKGKKFMIIAVKSNYKVYGVLGIEMNASKQEAVYKENIEQLQFLQELSTIVLERFYWEEVNEQLIVNQEQNRIANEIHDSVLQRLFSMSCSIFALMKKLEKATVDEMKDELNMIRNSTNKAMKELRSTIYGISWNKKGVNIFEKDIRNYIDEMKRLNDVNISVDITGNHELLSSKHKKALYRIICEGIANGLRHGKARNIDIILSIESEFSLLKIVDDGIGFDFKKVKNDKQKGLGIRNIHYLSQSFNGEINIDSKIGKGTTLEVTIPNSIQLIKKEEIV
jgi:signal transduction histidine kinase